MHYITGTSFTVSPSFKLTKSVRDKQFVPGLSYTLLSISKKENQYVYRFKGSNNTLVEINFISCNDADLFISKYRNERLPNYNYSSTEEILNLD